MDAALETHPEMEEPLRLQRDLIAAANALEGDQVQLSVDAESARERLKAGKPVLTAPQRDAFRDARMAFAEQVCGLITANRPELAQAIEDIRARLPALVGTGQERDTEGAWLAEFKQDDTMQQLVAFVARQAEMPFLHALATKASAVVDDLPPGQTSCPICGSQPVIAALRKPDGDRSLMCGACLTEWPVRRVGCPFCGSKETEGFTYHIDKDPAYRLYTCSACTRYLKTVDERQAKDVFPLPLEHTLTMGMDLAAIEQGF
ncbi:MAG: formate dehydrogenase accessory protein FdhE, partial [Anaerolineales bacterium]